MCKKYVGVAISALLLNNSNVYAGQLFYRYLSKNIDNFKQYAKKNEKSNCISLASHLPDLLFKYIIDDSRQEKKKKSRYGGGESTSQIEEIYGHARQYDTTAGYHIAWAAVFTKNGEALEEILERTDRPYEIEDSYSNNLMHICCFLNWEEGVKLLLRSAKYSQWNTKNDFKKTPYDICKKFCDEEMENIINDGRVFGQERKKSIKKETRNWRKKRYDYDDYDEVDNKRRTYKDSDDEISDRSVRSHLGYGLLFFDLLDDEKTELIEKELEEMKGRRFFSDPFSKPLDKYDNNLLHIMVLFQRSDLLNMVIEKTKHAINKTNKSGNTPLHIATSMHSEESVEQLLKSDHIDLCIKNKSNVIPLTLAIRNYKEYKPEHESAYKIIDMLLEHNSDRNSKKEDHKKKKIKDKQLYVKDQHGNTAYHLACMQLSFKIVFDLIRHGANVNILNNNRKTGGDLLIEIIDDSNPRRRNGKEISSKKLDSVLKEIQSLSESQEKNVGMGILLRRIRGKIVR